MSYTILQYYIASSHVSKATYCLCQQMNDLHTHMSFLSISRLFRFSLTRRLALPRLVVHYYIALQCPLFRLRVRNNMLCRIARQALLPSPEVSLSLYSTIHPQIKRQRNIIQRHTHACCMHLYSAVVRCTTGRIGSHEQFAGIFPIFVKISWLQRCTHW